jgi:hypothetical protein
MQTFQHQISKPSQIALGFFMRAFSPQRSSAKTSKTGRFYIRVAPTNQNVATAVHTM